MGRKEAQAEAQALKQNKARALDALLDSATITEAAEKAGISRKTLYSYMREDVEFARAYKAAQERLTLERMATVEADRQRATATIFSLMDDKTQPGAVRLKAAQTILEAATAAQQQAAAIASRNVSANSDPFDIFGRGD